MGDVFTLLLVGGFAFQVAAVVVLLNRLPSGAALQLVLAVAAYLVHGAIGIAVLIYCRPFLSDTSTAALGAVAALFGWIFAGHQIGAASAAFGAGLVRTVYSTYLPAFFVAGALCIIAALAIISVRKSSGAVVVTPAPARA